MTLKDIFHEKCCRHKLTEHEGVRYACDQCGAEFTAQGNLRRHKLSKHEQVKQKYHHQCHQLFNPTGTMGVRLVQVHVHGPGQLEAAQADKARRRHLRLLPVPGTVWKPRNTAQTHSHRTRGSQVIKTSFVIQATLSFLHHFHHQPHHHQTNGYPKTTQV